MAKFAVAQIVRLVSDYDTEGPILGISEDGKEVRYTVYTNTGKMMQFYESQLEAKPEKETLQTVNHMRFNADLTASLLRNPTINSLYSLNSGRIDYIPHQYRPVLKMIRSDRPRILIADGVGVGKTIEAGLILREMQARQDINSVLIICPRPLITEGKWDGEMKHRFGEEFLSLDGDSFRYCLKETDYEGEWPDRYQKCVLPYSLFDRANVEGDTRRGGGRISLLQLDPAPHFDLVIVDEAHHIRNTSTYAYRAVERFVENAESVIFLTATPVQLEYDDLFTLLNLLRPDLIPDKETFHRIAEPNYFINKASATVRGRGENWKKETHDLLIDACSETDWGQRVLSHNPDMQETIHKLEKETISEEERVELISEIENLHTFSKIINRTRRRDIGTFTQRKPITIEVPFTDAQKELHDEILSITHEILSTIHCTENTKFMMTTIRRQTASCLFGLVPMLEDILYRHMDEYVDEEYVSDITGLRPSDEKPVRERIEKIIEYAKKLPKEDPKLEALLKILSDTQKEGISKVMIFSTFRHTLRYLYGSLAGRDLRVGMMHGGVSDEERQDLRRRFQLPKEQSEAIDVLLFSEIGCEGLDYQFCNCMVNYDLPWNPMRIEQRIGRIDRNGQKSPFVTIFNMITPDTVDYDIYIRCFMRIDVFRQSVGDCEEILGNVASELQDIAANFNLTEAEKQERIQQMTDNKIRQLKEQALLEEKQYDFFGINLPENAIDQEIKEAANYWLSPDSLLNLVKTYLQSRLGESKEFILGEKALKTLRTSQELRSALLEDFKSLGIRRDASNRNWEKWLKQGDQFLQITFDSECSKENPEVVLISAQHPLIRQAAIYLEDEKRNVTVLKTKSNDVPAGEYHFTVYQWKIMGEKDDLQIRPITEDMKLNDIVLDLLKSSEDVSYSKAPDITEWADVENMHHILWSEALAEHKSRTSALINYKKGSLQTSFQARMNYLEDMLVKSRNNKTARIYEGSIRKAREDYEKRLNQLEDAGRRADIVTDILGYGILIVENNI